MFYETYKVRIVYISVIPALTNAAVSVTPRRRWVNCHETLWRFIHNQRDIGDWSGRERLHDSSSPLCERAAKRGEGGGRVVDAGRWSLH